MAFIQACGGKLKFTIPFICLYLFSRAIVIILFSPFLTRLGYGLPWKDAVVMIWGGLRGAVGLALALQVALDHETVGNKV